VRAPGFTLLEVLIALIIAGLAVAAMMQAVGGGLHATRTATLYDQALVRAQSHLASATHASALAAGDFQGDDGGGFRWRLRVLPVSVVPLRPVGLIGPRGQSAIPVALYSVIVQIAWKEGETTRQVQLETEQVGLGPR